MVRAMAGVMAVVAGWAEEGLVAAMARRLGVMAMVAMVVMMEAGAMAATEAATATAREEMEAATG